MINRKKTLVVNYAGLNVGGIENFFSKLMKYAIETGHRVIWLTTKMHVENAFYKDLVKNPNLEKIYVGHGRTTFKKIKINFDSSENIVMLSCEPLYFIAAEDLRKHAHVSSFSHFLLLPHFTGNAYYVERFFRNRFFKKQIYRYMQKLAHCWIDCDCILGFAKEHLISYEKNYDYSIDSKDEKVLKKIDKKREINIQKISQKANKRDQIFNIVSCARFDFPHKGYLLGLIKHFEVLKKKFPEIRLIIVGDGSGRQEVENEINLLSDFAKKDIELKGFLNFNDLCEVFDASMLNIGLAGGAISGAKCAVPTIVVRHYSYECEAYGFYENVKDKVLSSLKGNSIDRYVEQIILMSDKEYIKKCIDTYNIAYLDDESDPDFVFKIENRSSASTISILDFFVGKIINYMCWFKMRFMHEKGYDS